MSRLPLLLATAGLVLVAGCSSPGVTPARSNPTVSTTLAAPSQVSSPARVSVPAIGADSSLIEVDLDANRVLQAPPVEQPGQAAWYRRSGINGMPLVVLGHINGRVDGVSTPGVFARLAELPVGATVDVARGDSTVYTFTVTRVESYDKDAIPTAVIYGDTATPEIRVISCGGPFEGGVHGYANNVVAFGTLTGSRPA